MNEKKILTWSIIVCIVLYLIPNIFYICKFSNTNLSSAPSDWGVYGDFIGGSVNPVLTILNIIALVYLTHTVSKSEGKRATESLNVQKLITLNQMRHNAVFELSKALDSFTNITSEITSGNTQTFLNITLAINSFRNNQFYFFENLFTKEFDDKYFYPLRSAVEKITKAFQEMKDKIAIIESNQKTLSSYIQEFEAKKDIASNEESIELLEKIKKYSKENTTQIDFNILFTEELKTIAKEYVEQRTIFINEVNKYIIKELSPTKLS